MLREALKELNKRVYPGSRTDTPAVGGVTRWFKQDEIHQATHVHGDPEFLPWHREIVNRLEELLRQINPQLSLHYWDWTQDPRAIPNANLGGGITGTLNLFTSDFMGYGGSTRAEIGEPWLSAGYYVPGAILHRDATDNPADPPRTVLRNVSGSPATRAQDQAIVGASNYATMRALLEQVHGAMHGFVNMGSAHISFRDPFVFLLHSNVDRLFALWQIQSDQRFDPNRVYDPESGHAALNSNIEPWSTGHNFDEFGVEHFTRPWYAPENQGVPKTYKHPSVVTPPRYDTSPGPPTGPPAQGDDMQPGEVLNVGQSIKSSDGRYTFVYQGDGNVVLYRNVDGKPLWASNTAGRSVGVCIMQRDGNLVIYGRSGQAIWASNTWQNPGSRLVVQGDGNVVIYRPDGRAIWATNTWVPTGPTAQGDDMQPREVLNVGELIRSADGRYTFVYQGDGNLVLYRAADRKALWASNTWGRPSGVCIMQHDGNLVLYAPGGNAVWASNTPGNANSRLVVQGDGNVVIYRPDGRAIWATNTWVPTGPTAQGDDMQPGEVLNVVQAIRSADGRYTFVYQGDGNLVLYRNVDGKPLWASNTWGRPSGVCIMQRDGNLVLYAPGGNAIWASNTPGNPGSRLVAQNDGNVVIYRPDGRAIWATNTVQP